MKPIGNQLLEVSAPVGAAKISKPEAIAGASKERLRLKESDLAKFPAEFKDKDALVQRFIKGPCNAK